MDSYEKKYKEALERAKKYKLKEDLIITQDIFPELAESGDEKIRKDIKRAISVALEYSYFDKETANDCLAWLEKQAEVASDKDDIEAEEKGIRKAFNKIWEEKQGEQKPFDYENANIQQKDWAEIPFGAKDSELQEVSYYIPEGFHAEIDEKRVVIKKGEQKPAWSAEDERKIQDCIDAVSHVNLFKVYYQNELVEWLKSIKERIGGLTDFNVIEEVVQRNLLEEVVKQMSDTLLIETLLYRKKQGTLSIFYDERKEELVSFLKSICTWKPSDEQIRPLEYAIDYFKKKNNDTVYLESLYNDLKKL